MQLGDEGMASSIQFRCRSPLSRYIQKILSSGDRDYYKPTGGVRGGVGVVRGESSMMNICPDSNLGLERYDTIRVVYRG